MELIYLASQISNYGINSYATSVLFVAMLILWFAISIYRANPKDIKNRTAFYFYMSLFVWLFFWALTTFSTHPDVAYFWFKYFSYPGTIITSTLMYLFVVNWSPEMLEKRKRRLKIFFIFFTGHIIVNYFTKLFILPGATLYSFGYASDYSLSGGIMILIWAIPVVLMFKDLKYMRRTAKDPMLRRSIVIITIGFYILLIAVTDYLGGIFPELGLFPFGHFCIFTSVIFISFAISRYHFMDIGATLHRLLVLFVTYALIGFPFSIVIYFLLPNLVARGLILPVIFVVVGLYLFSWSKGILQPKIDSWLKGGGKKYKEKIIDLNEKIFASNTFDDLVGNVLVGLHKTFSPKLMSYYIFNKNSCLLSAEMKEGGDVQINRDVGEDISNAFKMFLEDERLGVILSHKKILHKQEYIHSEGKAGRREILNLFGGGEAELIVLVRNDEGVVSFIILGKKEGGEHYTVADVNILKEIEKSIGFITKGLLSFEEVLDQEKVLKDSLEREVEKRSKELVKKNKELEDFQKKTGDREHKMSELKKQLEDLESRVAGSV